MKRITKLILGLAGAGIAILALLLCNFYVSFGYGGWRGFLAEFRRLPGDEKLEALRGGAAARLAQAHAEAASVAGLTPYEETFSDMCAKGEHGWKRSDPYAYVCAYRVTRYYGTDRDYRELLLDLEKDLGDAGWQIEARTPEQPTISAAMRGYSGEMYLLELPAYRKVVDGQSMTLVINGFDGYGVHWTQSGDEPDPFGFGIGLGQDVYKNSSNGSPKGVFDRIVASGRQAIMIAISTGYFGN
jgi:hypothetical protein